MAERAVDRLQPTILAQLRQYGGGVTHIAVSWTQTNPMVDADGRPVGGWEWERWEWQFGPTAGEAYGWYVAPTKLEVKRPGWYRERWMWWFDGRTTTTYHPPKLPDAMHPLRIDDYRT